MSCDDVLRACDRSVKDLEAERAALQGLVGVQGKALEAERAEVARVRRAYDSRTSPLVWIGLGVLAGAAGAIYLSK